MHVPDQGMKSFLHRHTIPQLVVSCLSRAYPPMVCEFRGKYSYYKLTVPIPAPLLPRPRFYPILRTICDRK